MIKQNNFSKTNYQILWKKLSEEESIYSFLFSTSKAEINYHPKTTSIYDYDKKNNDHIERNVNFFELPDVLNTFFNWSKQDVTPILNIYCKIKQNIHPLMVQNDWGRVKWLSYLTNCSENSLKKKITTPFPKKEHFQQGKSVIKKPKQLRYIPYRCLPSEHISYWSSCWNIPRLSHWYPNPIHSPWFDNRHWSDSSSAGGFGSENLPSSSKNKNQLWPNLSDTRINWDNLEESEV